MMPRRLTAIVVAALALALAGCAGGSDAVDVNNGGQFRFVAGTPTGEVIAAADRGTSPSFGGTLLGGGEFSSSTLDGDVSVINFWGSWCAPCRVESPQFQQVYAEVADQGVQFLGINVKDSDQMARAFETGQKITYPSIYDPRGETALIFRNFPPSSIPSTILLDRHGKVAAVYLGAVAQDDLRAVLDQLLAET